MGYRTTFLHGIGWNGSLKVVTKVIAVGKLAVISRLLSPNDFGVFALALIAISLFEVFTETGINTIIVQSEKKLAHFVDTAWIISIFRGIAISVLMLALAYPLSSFYHEPSLPPLIFIACLVPLVRGFINPAIVSVYKDLKFHHDTMFRLSLVVVETLATIVLAIIIPGPLALLLPMVLSAIVEVMFSFFFFSPRPTWKFKRDVFQEIMAGMKWLNGLSILEYLRKTLDDLTVGRMLGTSSLGIYRLGYNLPQASVTELGTSVIYSSFPVYKRLLNEPARLQKAFFQVVGGSSLILLFPTLLMVFFPNEVISVVLGDQWVLASTVLPFLALAGYVQGVVAIGSTLLTARQAYTHHFALIASSCLALGLTLYPLILTYGLKGAGMSVLFSRIITIPIFIFYAQKALTSSNE